MQYDFVTHSFLYLPKLEKQIHCKGRGAMSDNLAMNG